MTRHVTTLPKIASVSQIIRALKTTTHNLFPVVAASTKALVGTVTRPDLIRLLLRDSRGANLLSNEAICRLKGRVDADYDRKLIGNGIFCPASLVLMFWRHYRIINCRCY